MTPTRERAIVALTKVLPAAFGAGVVESGRHAAALAVAAEDGREVADVALAEGVSSLGAEVAWRALELASREELEAIVEKRILRLCVYEVDVR